jgi:hypothetical protein
LVLFETGVNEFDGSGFEIEGFEEFLVLFETSVNEFDFGANFVFLIFKDVVLANDINNIFELSDILKKFADFFGDVVDGVVDKGEANDGIQEFEMPILKFIELILINFFVHAFKLLLNNSKENIVLVGGKEGLYDMPGDKQLIQ